MVGFVYMCMRSKGRTEPAEQYLHESACGLEENHVEIDARFVEVLERVAEKCPTQCVHAAAGCGSCFNAEKPAAVFWVAQGDLTEQLAVKYDIDEDVDGFSRHELGSLITDVAEEKGVDYSWNGSVNKAVMLGVAGKYENLSPGTKVERRGRVGVVVNNGAVYDDETPYKVYNQKDYDGFGYGGELEARFAEKSEAEEYISGEDEEDYQITHARMDAKCDGTVLVQFEGKDQVETVLRTELTVLDDSQ